MDYLYRLGRAGSVALFVLLMFVGAALANTVTAHPQTVPPADTTTAKPSHILGAPVLTEAAKLTEARASAEPSEGHERGQDTQSCTVQAQSARATAGADESGDEDQAGDSDEQSCHVPKVHQGSASGERGDEDGSGGSDD